MNQEDKELLLKELCTRQACGVKVQYNGKIYTIDYVSPKYKEVKLDIPDNYTVGISEVKPFLRSMSSMTEEEKDELYDWGWEYTGNDIITGGFTDADNLYKNYEKSLHDLKWLADWLNANKFDYRGLIPKGLALEALKGMYD